MIKTEHILEFDKIKETWKTFALTESARTEIEKTEPMMSEREVAARLRETSEAKNMIEKFGQPPLAAMSNIREWMHIAETGGCLTPEQLEEAEKALVAVERMKNISAREKTIIFLWHFMRKIYIALRISGRPSASRSGAVRYATEHHVR